jgi:hypothetical protein
MKKLSLFLLTLILALSLFAGPEIKFEKTQVNFGEIESGKVIDLEFKFQNTGDELLVIKKISPSCGCTATKLDKKEYKPGEKGTIPVKFYSKGYSSEIIKSITVVTNDKKNPYTRLKVRGNVILKDFPMAKLSIEKIDFKKVKIGKKYVRKIKIQNVGTEDLKILEATIYPEISTEFDKKLIKPKKEGLLILEFKPMEKGPFSSFIRIRTNSYRRALVLLRIKAQVE